MKNIRKITCIAVAGMALTALSSTAIAATADCGGCSSMTTPMADKGKADKDYPLDTCVVSGEKLGEMGKPFVFKYKGQEVQLCCPKCKKKFDKDPEKFMKKIEEAKAKAKK